MAESASAYSCGVWCASAPSYGLSENIGVMPMVVAELKFRNVQRHVFGAHLVECADDAALEQRPETLNRVGVNGTHNVFLFRVIHDLVRIGIAKLRVAAPRVRREQADLVRHDLLNEGVRLL